jgi:hypothetical protein
VERDIGDEELTVFGFDGGVGGGDYDGERTSWSEVIGHSDEWMDCSMRDMCLIVSGVVEGQSCVAKCLVPSECWWNPSVGRIRTLVELLTIAILRRNLNPALATSLIVIYSANTRASNVACRGR